MTFFRKLRHALGFNDDSIFETDSDTAYDSIPEHSEDTSATPLGKSDVYVTQDMREAIFSHVIKVFNDALPEFLARSVDADTQQKLIFEGLDQGIKDYLARIGADADNRCEQRWSSEQAGMRAEMDDLRRKSEQVAQERADLKQKQLSADRQKRALSDRLKDLENQVRRLEAEREQFDLENKSLLNKLKAIAVSRRRNRGSKRAQPRRFRQNKCRKPQPAGSIGAGIRTQPHSRRNDSRFASAP